MSTIIILTPPPTEKPKSAPVGEPVDAVRAGNSQVEFQGGRPSFLRLCRIVIALFRAWRS